MTAPARASLPCVLLLLLLLLLHCAIFIAARRLAGIRAGEGGPEGASQGMDRETEGGTNVCCPRPSLTIRLRVCVSGSGLRQRGSRCKAQIRQAAREWRRGIG